MPFDPAYPADGIRIRAVDFRGQFAALKALIDAQAAQIAALPTAAEVDAAIAEAVTTTTNNLLSASSNNTNPVGVIGTTPGDPPSGSDVQVVYDKVNEFINAARRP